MFRPLFAKEWRQLRTLRWAGIALGVAMPALAAAGAEAGRRGWLPFGRGGDWSNQEIFAELAPAMVCLFVWPLMALLLAAQAFTGDAATGTESFLLERPVPRGRIWSARVLAAAGSAFALAVVTGMAALATALLAVGGGRLDPGPLGGVAAAGVAATVLAVLAALPSAALIRSPVGTVLAGLLFAAVPVLAAAFLGAAYPFATLGASPLPVGLFVPWLLVIGYALASRFAETRGEPAGGGQRWRALRVLVVSAAAVAALFCAGAALAVRSLPQGYEVVPSPRDDVAVVLANWGPGHLLDTRTGAVVHRVPPPAYAAAWNGDGSVLAIASAGSVFGAMDAVWRVEFLGPDGRATAPPLTGSGDTYPLELQWSGERVVILASGVEAHGATALLRGVPGETALVPMSYRSTGGSLRLVSGDAEGILLLERADADETAPTRIVRLEWNGSDASVAWERRLPLRGFLSPFSSPLSPSGRYLTIHVYEQVDNPHPEDGGPAHVNRVRPVVVDLETGDWTEIEGRAGLAAWTEGDRLAWVAREANASAVLTGTPDGESRFERAWADARVVISSSPDRRLALVTVLPRTEEDPIPPFAADSFEPTLWPEGGVLVPTARELWLFNPSDRHWTRLPDDASGPDSFFAAGWAGPRTVYRNAGGRLVFESLTGTR